MAYTVRNSTDLVICANHPRYSDTKNSACIELYALLEAEHTDGKHDDRNYAMTGEIDTYVGDGTSSRTITLSNTSLTPRFFIIWADLTSVPVNYISALSDPAAFSRTSTTISSLFSSHVGGFILETGAYNTNGVTYYYCVLGIDITSIYTPAGGSNDPDWVEDGDLGQADGSDSSVCDRVEEHIDTALDAEHNGATGAHDTPPFSGFAKIECGTWTGTIGNDIVTLEDDSLDIQYVFYFRDASEDLMSASESMGAGDSKEEIVAAFSANGIQSMGTGTFTAKTLAATTYYYCTIGV